MSWQWNEENIEEWLIPQKRQLKFPDKVIRLVTQSKLTWETFDYLNKKCHIPEEKIVEKTIEYHQSHPLMVSFEFAMFFLLPQWAGKWRRIYGEGGPDDPSPHFSIASR